MFIFGGQFKRATVARRMVGLAGYFLKSALARIVRDHPGLETGSAVPELAVEPGEPLLDVRLEDRLSLEQIAAVTAAYEDGSSAAVLAAELGVSKTGLLKLLRAAGVAIRTPRGLSGAEVLEAARLYESGLLLREIGKRFGVSRDCVRLALLRCGVVMRPGLGARKPDSGRQGPRGSNS